MSNQQTNVPTEEQIIIELEKSLRMIAFPNNGQQRTKSIVAEFSEPIHRAKQVTILHGKKFEYIYDRQAKEMLLYTSYSNQLVDEEFLMIMNTLLAQKPHFAKVFTQIDSWIPKY